MSIDNRGGEYSFRIKVLTGLSDAVKSLRTIASSQGKVSEVSKNPFLIRISDLEYLNAEASSISVHNAGLADGLVLDVKILPGETMNFDAGGLGCYFPKLSFYADGSGTDLVITYVTK